MTRGSGYWADAGSAAGTAPVPALSLAANAFAGLAWSGGSAPQISIGPNKGYIITWDVTIAHGGTTHGIDPGASTAHSAAPLYHTARTVSVPGSTQASVTPAAGTTAGVGQG